MTADFHLTFAHTMIENYINRERFLILIPAT